MLVPAENQKQQMLQDSSYTTDYLQENILFNKYLDTPSEMYARMMQVRFENDLKAEKFIKQVDSYKYDRNFIKRYTEDFTTPALNNLAEKNNNKKEKSLNLIIAKHNENSYG